MTPVQEAVFTFIRERIEAVGVAPKLEEIGHAFNFSRARASQVVNAIIDHGKLRRKARRGMAGILLPGHLDLTVATTDALRSELARRGVTLDALAVPTPISWDGRACAAYHCTTTVSPGQLMCRDHWFQLPAKMRSSIMNAWSGRHVQAYQDAVEAARDYLGGFTRVAERVE